MEQSLLKRLCITMFDIRMDFSDTKLTKIRKQYCIELCKEYLRFNKQDEIIKDVLKHIKKFKVGTTDGRCFRDMKYNYNFLERRYNLCIKGY